MIPVLCAAVGITAATATGGVTGHWLSDRAHLHSNGLNSVAAGMMLCAAVQGLVIPGLVLCEGSPLPICVGLCLGGVLLDAMGKLLPLLLQGSALCGKGGIRCGLFVLAMALHHFPEGVAAGVSFGTGRAEDALMVCAGIAIQNLPEAMVVMWLLHDAEMPAAVGYGTVAAGGFLELVGLLMGCAAVHVVTAALPVLLAVAAGTMLFVVTDEMIPRSHSEENASGAYGLLIGFCAMLLLSYAAKCVI